MALVVLVILTVLLVLVVLLGTLAGALAKQAGVVLLVLIGTLAELAGVILLGLVEALAEQAKWTSTRTTEVVAALFKIHANEDAVAECGAELAGVHCAIVVYDSVTVSKDERRYRDFRLSRFW